MTDKFQRFPITTYRNTMPTRWPRTMPLLRPRHFRHGSFDRCPVPDGEDCQALHECGTPRCLVGNVLVAFDRDPRGVSWVDSEIDGTLRGPLRSFVERLALELQIPFSRDEEVWLWGLSDRFEGGTTMHEVTAACAARAWRRAIEYFGYTEDL